MKVWFNQSFSMRNFVRRIVADRPRIELCISAIDGQSPARDIAPTFWTEPARGAGNYTDWLLQTAVRHGVDVMVPQRGKRDVAQELDRFSDQGIAVHLTADAEMLDLLDDKAAFTASLGNDPYLCTTFVAATASAFEQAVGTLARDGGVACVKPIRGVYGAGYWTLDADGPLAHLADPDARRISPEAYAASLRRAEAQGEPFALLVMEYLPGLEASVDIVADRGEVLLSAVRTKLDANRQRIETHHALIPHASSLVRQHCLHGAVNVQYKQDRGGAWRILEINARAAGGASYCDEVGIPFCATWIDVITGSATPFDARIDAEIVAVTRAEPRHFPAVQNGSAGTSQA
jgi:hypothetical protein